MKSETKEKKPDKNPILKGVELKDFRMVAHMSFEKKHLSKRTGIFVCEGKPLHDRILVMETSVRITNPYLRRYGKSEQLFYLNEKDAPSFKTIEELVLHYHS